MGAKGRPKYLLSGSFGLIGKTPTREGGARDGETDWLVEASVHYVLPISDRVAFLPGAGLGALYGVTGSEKADSQPARLGSSAVHVGLPVEVFYTF